MAQDHIWHPGIFFLGHFFQAVHVPHHHSGRILFTKVPIGTVISHALPMPQMVVPGYQHPLLPQILGKGPVAPNIFRHAVDHLDNTDYLSLRDPPDGMDF